MTNIGDPGGRKLSDALIEFAQPLLREAGDDVPEHVVLSALQTASMLWNAIVHERLFDDEWPAARIESVIAPREAPLELRRAVAEMLAAKRAEAPFDARWIGYVEFVPVSEYELSLRVTGAPASAMDRARSRAAFEAASLAPGSPFGFEPEAATPPRAPRRNRPSKARTRASAASSADGEEPWRTLYGRMRELHALAPWEEHLDTDVFGLRLVGEDETFWCSVMGAADELYGVALYVGDEGYAVYRGLQIDTTTEAASLGFEGWLFTFVDREELSAAERRNIKASGLRFRGRGAWPQLSRVRRGRLPRAVPEADLSRCVRLLDALCRTLEARAKAGIPAPVDLDGDLPVHVVGAEGIELLTGRPGPVPPPALPNVDQLSVARLLANSAPRGGTIEFDAFPLEARLVDDDGWDYLPLLYLAADGERGTVLAPEMGLPEEREAECAQKLLQALANHGRLPQAVHVARPWVERSVAPTLAALAVPLVLDESLEHVDDAAGAISEWMSR